MFDVEVDAADAAQAETVLKTACEQLPANTVVDNFSIELGCCARRSSSFRARTPTRT